MVGFLKFEASSPFLHLTIVGLMEAYSILDFQVTDEEGRRRFHGAFTGGFSAGYYNTVGSKEGRTECTFCTCIVLWYVRNQVSLVSMLITLQVGPLSPSRHHARREPNQKNRAYIALWMKTRKQ